MFGVKSAASHDVKATHLGAQTAHNAKLLHLPTSDGLEYHFFILFFFVDRTVLNTKDFTFP